MCSYWLHGWLQQVHRFPRTFPVPLNVRVRQIYTIMETNQLSRILSIHDTAQYQGCRLIVFFVCVPAHLEFTDANGRICIFLFESSVTSPPSPTEEERTTRVDGQAGETSLTQEQQQHSTRYPVGIKEEAKVLLPLLLFLILLVSFSLLVLAIASGG